MTRVKSSQVNSEVASKKGVAMVTCDWRFHVDHGLLLAKELSALVYNSQCY